MLLNVDPEVSNRAVDDANALEGSGLAPEETLSEILALYPPAELQGRLQKLRLQLLAVEAQAQPMPSEYSQLTSQELFHINRLADAELEKNLNPETAKTYSRERTLAALLVRTMLCFGQPASKAWAIRCLIFSTGEIPVVKALEGQITLILSKSPGDSLSQATIHGFCLPAIMPNYKTALPDSLEGIDRPYADAFELPDLLGLGKQILNFMCAEGLTELKGFGVRETTAKDAVKNFLKSFNDSRITIEKISKALASIIKYQTGDQALAWIVTADTSNAGQARMHYSRYGISTVDDAYRRAARRLGRIFGYAPIGIKVSPKVAQEVVTVGARFVVELEFIKNLIASLVVIITRRKPNKLNAEEVREYHLYYLLYTLLYQSIITGMRAVTEPHDVYLAWLQAGQPNRDLVVSLSDKDSAYTERARPVVITSELAQHFSYYQEHREQLPKLIKTLNAWIPVNRRHLPFIVITPQIRVETVTPTWIAAFLKALTDHDIPVNFSRAFLRTELVSRGCNVEVIDAHLGHSNFGESPYNKLSTFDYGLHFEHLKTQLGEIEKDLGLGPIPSKLMSRDGGELVS